MMQLPRQGEDFTPALVYWMAQCDLKPADVAQGSGVCLSVVYKIHAGDIHLPQQENYAKLCRFLLEAITARVVAYVGEHVTVPVTGPHAASAHYKRLADNLRLERQA